MNAIADPRCARGFALEVGLGLVLGLASTAIIHTAMESSGLPRGNRIAVGLTGAALGLLGTAAWAQWRQPCA